MLLLCNCVPLTLIKQPFPLLLPHKPSSWCHFIQVSYTNTLGVRVIPSISTVCCEVADPCISLLLCSC